MHRFAVILDAPRSRLRPMLVVASIALVLPTLSASASNDPAMECGAAALMEYQSRKVAILAPRNSDSAEEMIHRLASIDGAIAIRRLEEEYCLKFAQCISKPTDTPLVLASHFNSCIGDEDAERVLDDLRDRGSNAINEFISRLKEE
jgi:hypothetical protein